MTPDERRHVLEDLLAKVRRSASDRGIELPKELPPGTFKRGRELAKAAAPEQEPEDRATELELRPAEEMEASASLPVEDEPALLSNGHGQGAVVLTRFSEAAIGTHAPLALVDAPLPDPTESPAFKSMQARVVPPAAPPEHEPGVDDDDDDSPATSVSISFGAEPEVERTAGGAQSSSAFEAAFDDEVTATGDPAQIEAMALASEAEDGDRPTRVSSMPAVPLSLDDLDLSDLGSAMPPPPMPAPPMAAPASKSPAYLKPPPVVRPPPAPPAPVPPPVQLAPESAEPATLDPGLVAAVAPHEPAAPLPPEEAAPVSSQRLVTDLDRIEDHSPLDVEEPLPESGEVESQRYPAGRSDEVARDVTLDPHAASPTPRPPPPRQEAEDVLADRTAEVRGLGSVLVVERPALEPGIAVAVFRGSPAPARRDTFGELLDRALDLGAEQA